MKVEPRGWKAVAALAVIVAALAGKFFLEVSTLEAGAAERIKFWLRGEYVAGGRRAAEPQ